MSADAIVPPRRRRRPAGTVRRITVSLDAALLEALDETAEELVIHRGKIIEVAVEHYLAKLELPRR